MRSILIIIGTRPNFVKVTQFKKVAAKYPEVNVTIVHTGQHYDQNMAEVFFSQFDLQPDHVLNLTSKSVVGQIGEMMMKLGELIQRIGRPDIIITPGDVNSTLCTAITANKMGIPLAHLESGLRSYDRGMPEEINRILTDEISDHFFVSEPSGVENLNNEGKHGKVHYVGNTMIDTLVGFESQIQESSIIEDLGLVGEFVLMTLHRPAVVDCKERLQKLIELLIELTMVQKKTVVFPVHPRTLNNLVKFNLKKDFDNIEDLISTEALGYFEFQKLVSACKFVITDSGGLQEETTFRQVPCLTLRDNTERPVTTDIGSNTLVPFNLKDILELISQIDLGTYKTSEIPEYWDGKATERIMEVLARL